MLFYFPFSKQITEDFFPFFLQLLYSLLLLMSPPVINHEHITILINSLTR